MNTNLWILKFWYNNDYKLLKHVFLNLSVLKTNVLIVNYNNIICYFSCIKAILLNPWSSNAFEYNVDFKLLNLL